MLSYIKYKSNNSINKDKSIITPYEKKRTQLTCFSLDAVFNIKYTSIKPHHFNCNGSLSSRPLGKREKEVENRKLKSIRLVT